jgi:phage gpG-like protein
VSRLNIDVDVRVAAAERPLDVLAERLAHPAALFKAAADELRAIETERFSRGGPGWPADKPETITRKLKAGQDPRVLRATRKLMASLTREQDRDAVERITGTVLRFGTRRRYANALKRRRPFLGLDAARARRVAAAISDAIFDEE